VAVRVAEQRHVAGRRGGCYGRRNLTVAVTVVTVATVAVTAVMAVTAVTFSDEHINKFPQTVQMQSYVKFI
jgi:hypothetical protein